MWKGRYEQHMADSRVEELDRTNTQQRKSTHTRAIEVSSQSKRSVLLNFFCTYTRRSSAAHRPAAITHSAKRLAIPHKHLIYSPTLNAKCLVGYWDHYPKPLNIHSVALASRTEESSRQCATSYTILHWIHISLLLLSVVGFASWIRFVGQIMSRMNGMDFKYDDETTTTSSISAIGKEWARAAQASKWIYVWDECVVKCFILVFRRNHWSCILIDTRRWLFSSSPSSSSLATMTFQKWKKFQIFVSCIVFTLHSAQAHIFLGNRRAFAMSGNWNFITTKIRQLTIVENYYYCLARQQYFALWNIVVANTENGRRKSKKMISRYSFSSSFRFHFQSSLATRL